MWLTSGVQINVLRFVLSYIQSGKKGSNVLLPMVCPFVQVGSHMAPKTKDGDGCDAKNKASEWQFKLIGDKYWL